MRRFEQHLWSYVKITPAPSSRGQAPTKSGGSQVTGAPTAAAAVGEGEEKRKVVQSDEKEKKEEDEEGEVKATP